MYEGWRLDLVKGACLDSRSAGREHDIDKNPSVQLSNGGVVWCAYSSGKAARGLGGMAFAQEVCSEEMENWRRGRDEVETNLARPTVPTLLSL